jgi:hypothetical protein
MKSNDHADAVGAAGIADVLETVALGRVDAHVGEALAGDIGDIAGDVVGPYSDHRRSRASR